MCFWIGSNLGLIRAGIPGVAGRLGVPAKTINFWKRAVFFSRVSAKKNWVFFRLLGVFLCFLGVFLRFWGCFCAFGVFFLFFARQRDFFWGLIF